MCEPTTIMASIGALTTGIQVVAQRQQGKAEMVAAENAALSDYIQIQELQRQQSEDYNVEVSERIAQSMRERARAMVAMGEAGVTGLSPLRELAASYMLAQKDTGIMNVNYSNKVKQSKAMAYDVFATNTARKTKGRSMMGTPWSSILQIGAAAVGGYYQGQMMGTQAGMPNKSQTPYNYYNAIEDTGYNTSGSMSRILRNRGVQ